MTAVVAGKNARERARASARRGEAAASWDDDDFIVRAFISNAVARVVAIESADPTRLGATRGRTHSRSAPRAMRSSRAPRPRVRAPVVLSVAVALAAASVAAAASAASVLPGLSPDVLVVGDVALARVEARRRSAAVDAARDAPEQTAARDGEADEPPGEDPGAASNARGAEVDRDHDHHHDHDHDHHHDHRRRHDPAGETDASSRPWTLRAQALLASLATSCVSLVTLALFPFVANRRASEDEASAESRAARVRVVALALSAFGAGALLGDAFLHQLPHAYAFAAAEENKNHHGEGENHHHHHHGDHRDDLLGEAHSHSHSHSAFGVGSFLSALRAQRVGLAAVAGVAAFYFVERAVERSRSAGGGCARHGPHRTGAGSERERAAKNASGGRRVVASGDDLSDGGGGGFLSSDDDAAAGNSRARSRSRTVKKRRSSASAVSPRRASPAAAKRGVGARGTRRGAAVAPESPPPRAKTGGRSDRSDLSKDLSEPLPPPPLAPAAVLNLLADAAHNFFDGVSLGVAFLAGGSVAGWRAAAATVAHELPQEVGDYGVLVASGCDPLRAIALNFLSALASLLGTLVALAAHRSVGGAEGSEGVGGGGGGGGGEMGDFFLGFDRGVADAFVAGGFVFLAAGSAFGEASKATRGIWDEALVAACVALGVGACAATHAGGGCEHRHG